MIIRSHALVPIHAPPIADGAVLLNGREIKAVGRADEILAAHPGQPVVDLGAMALLPGLINAHCHLDYTILRNAILPPKSFTAWVQRINALKRSLGPDEYLDSIARGFEQCIAFGTTTVCTIESFPELMPRISAPPIRTWWFYEMIDVRHRVTTDDVVAGALTFFQNRGGSLANFGLSPHAPFTASLDLYRLANDCAEAFAMPLTTHVAESDEEFEMFRDAAGPLYEFLAGILRPMGDCGGATPFAHLWNAGAIDARWMLAHMNELAEDDFNLIASLPRGAKPTVVHCPGTHEYFGRKPFPWKRLADLGVNLCAGTDSLASTDSLSLLAELRRLRRNVQELTPAQLLDAVTRNPARALNREQRLGRIAPGALADLIAIPCTGSLSTVCEEIICHTEPVPWMMIDGQVIRGFGRAC
jgi:cytosine/adenosine deaminase-related metal-dependent hydrolase